MTFDLNLVPCQELQGDFINVQMSKYAIEQIETDEFTHLHICKFAD